MEKCRPFLKWAGGKYLLTDRIKTLLPAGECLIEPFVGAGAVFLNTNYPRYILNDNNADLINLYNVLKREKQRFIKDAKKLFSEKNNQESAYYDLREQFNTSKNKRERSLLFLYLNRHSYNGLCRYNNSGGFNVPFGSFKRPYFPAKEMTYFAQKAQQATFVCKDFANVIQQAQANDVIYCDPPYVPLSQSAYFTQYHQQFSLEQQQQLADLAHTSAKRDIKVLISNHYTDFTRQAYANAELTTFKVRRNISCKGQKRLAVEEVLALFS